MNVTGTYVLTRCELNADKQYISAKSSIVVAPGLIADPETSSFDFDASTLPKKSLKKVDVKIDLSELGTIKSINASAEDRTLPTIAAVVKGLLQVFTLGINSGIRFYGENAPALQRPPCSPGTEANLLKASELTSAIARLKEQATRLSVDTSQKASSEAVSRDLAAISAKIATLEARLGELRAKSLSLEWKATITPVAKHMSEPPGGKCRINETDGVLYTTGPSAESITAANWATGTSAEQLAKKLAVKLCLGMPSDAAVEELPNPKSYQIVFRRAVTARFTIGLEQNNTGVEITQPSVAGSVVVPQWGKYSVIDLDTALGEDKKYSLAFDPAGRIASVQFSRAARAENIASGLAGVMADGVNLQKAIEHGSEDVAIADLERQKKYYELEVAVKAAREKYLQQLEEEKKD